MKLTENSQIQIPIAMKNRCQKPILSITSHHLTSYYTLAVVVALVIATPAMKIKILSIKKTVNL